MNSFVLCKACKPTLMVPTVSLTVVHTHAEIECRQSCKARPGREWPGDAGHIGRTHRQDSRSTALLPEEWGIRMLHHPVSGLPWAKPKGWDTCRCVSGWFRECKYPLIHLHVTGFGQSMPEWRASTTCVWRWVQERGNPLKICSVGYADSQAFIVMHKCWKPIIPAWIVGCAKSREKKASRKGTTKSVLRCAFASLRETSSSCLGDSMPALLGFSPKWEFLWICELANFDGSHGLRHCH